MDDPLGYAGRRVVVTGSASGMGQATARILTELGAAVTALDIAPTTARVDQAVEVDLRDPAAIDEAIEVIGAPVDSVFSCAGLPGPPFSDLDTMLVNFVGPRALVEGLLPAMPAGSSVACISSAAGIGWQQNLETITPLLETDSFDAGRAWVDANPDAYAMSAYAFSKQVIDAWVCWRAADLAGTGIRLNCTNPGPTDTPMMPAFHAAVGKELVDMAVGPIGRYSTAEEQAWPLVLLNSSRMSYVTGEVLWSDGGFLGALATGKLELGFGGT